MSKGMQGSGTPGRGGAVLAVALLGVALPFAAPAQAWAQDTLTLELSTGLEYDSNPLGMTAGEGAKPIEGDALGYYFANGELVMGAGAEGMVTAAVRHGGRLFRREGTAHTLLSQVEAAYQGGLGTGWRVGVEGDFKDRSEATSRRDYHRGGARAWLQATGPWVQASVGGGWRYLVFKPAKESSSQGPELGTALRLTMTSALWLHGTYTFALRLFDTDAWQPQLNAEPPAPGADQRRDVFHLGRLGLSHRSWLVAEAHYALGINRSNAYGYDLLRHSVELMATMPLLWDLYLGLRAEVQKTRYGDEVVLDAQFRLDDEDRNTLVLSLARPLGESWEVEARYSLHRQEFGLSEPYLRQTALVSLNYLTDWQLRAAD